MVITHYSPHEGERWRPWPFSARMRPLLDVLNTTQRQHYITLNLGLGCHGKIVYRTVHALILDDGQIWDCYGGWRNMSGFAGRPSESPP